MRPAVRWWNPLLRAHSVSPTNSASGSRCRSAEADFLRARTDHGPELGTVHRLHVGSEPSVTVDPFLHLLRVVGQHVGAGPIARHLDPGREPSVDKGRVKPEARAWSGANPVERDDAQDQGAGGVADAVDDDPLAAVADGGVFELVLIDEAAVVLADAIIRERGASRSGDHASRAHDGQKEIERKHPRPQRPIRPAVMPSLSGRNLTARHAFSRS